MLKGILQNDLFYCNHLGVSENDERDILHRYREYGFLRLDSVSEDELHKRLKPNYDENCIFMFQQLG